MRKVSHILQGKDAKVLTVPQKRVLEVSASWPNTTSGRCW